MMKMGQRVGNTLSMSKSSVSEHCVFNPQRFALARRRRGLKMSELAEKIGVDPRSVTNYESGSAAPSSETTEQICRVLDFPEEFFYGESLDEIDPSTASFRSLARMTAGKRDMALGQGTMCVHLNNWFAGRFKMPAAMIPNVTLATPEAAAAIVRTEWGLGVQPISNIIHLLESKGVRVFSLSVKAVEVDAFSTWKGNTPYIMLNVQKTAEHSRFDAAHELGHLVMHRSGAPTGKEAETEANRFASAFLMPEADVLANTRQNPGIASLIQWKKRWRVSLAALNYRMHQLSMTTEYHYRHLCIQISKMGGRTSEIQGIPRERSELLEKMLRSLAQDGVSRSKIAADLAVSPSELEEMMFGLTMTAINGTRVGGPTTAKKATGISLVAKGLSEDAGSLKS
jgi:Zn-dependent peptidase ImmA (M78 family)/DNA-binding XRE family transcriptional regulator